MPEQNKRSTEQRIVCAAIQLTYLDRERNTQTVTIAGARHHDGIMNNVIIPLIDDDTNRIVQRVQGFIDQHGTFLTREEAWAIAVQQDQIRFKGGWPEGKLYSENLY